jgi:hypothetical protein
MQRDTKDCLGGSNHDVPNTKGSRGFEDVVCLGDIRVEDNVVCLDLLISLAFKVLQETYGF